MFTGIIQHIGQVHELVARDQNSNSLLIAHQFLDWGWNVQHGDSIAINGVCLSVVSFNEKYVEFQLAEATLKNTTTGLLKEGQSVHMELPLNALTPMGGHQVLGHVDTTAQVSHVKKVEDRLLLTIKVGQEFDQYLVPKGSVAIDGVSLTVQALGEESAQSASFQCELLPVTLEKTHFDSLKKGDKVNVEFDVIGKYVAKHIEAYINRVNHSRKESP